MIKTEIYQYNNFFEDGLEIEFDFSVIKINLIIHNKIFFERNHI